MAKSTPFIDLCDNEVFRSVCTFGCSNIWDVALKGEGVCDKHDNIASDRFNLASIRAHEDIEVNGRIIEKGETVQLQHGDTVAICGGELVYKQAQSNSSSHTRRGENSDAEMQGVLKAEMLTIWDTLYCCFLPTRYLGAAAQSPKTNHTPPGRQLCAHFNSSNDVLSMHSIHTRIMEGHYSSTRHCLDDLRALFLLGKEYPTYSIIHKDGQVLLEVVDKFILEENEKISLNKKPTKRKPESQNIKLDNLTIPLPKIPKNSTNDNNDIIM